MFLPDARTPTRSPKFSTLADRMVTLPEAPVEAYVSLLGFKETDQAVDAADEKEGLLGQVYQIGAPGSGSSPLR